LTRNEFRSGRQSDNISKTLGYDYILSQCQYEDFFGKEHLKLLSQICCGSYDTILIFKDLNEKQKNFLLEILKLILGDYCQVVQSEIDYVDENVKIYVLDNFELDDTEIDEYICKIYESNTFGIPIIMCDKLPITNFKEDWFWRRVSVVPNTDAQKIKMFSPMCGKLIIHRFLFQNQKFKMPPAVIRATEDYRTYCTSFEMIRLNDCVAHVPKIIKETNIYSFFTNGELRNVTLQNVDLRGIDMSEIYIEFCDFSGSNFRGSKFDGAIIKNTKMCNVDFRLVTMFNGRMNDVDFTDATFDNTIFIASIIRKSNFTNVNMDDMDDSTKYEKCIGI